MDIGQTIAFIDSELARTLEDYESWFETGPELLRHRPRTGWSIGQILEHVTLTNHFLLILIRKGKKKALELAAKKELTVELTGYRSNLDELEKIAEHGSFKWIRPEHMEPKGTSALAEIRALLEGQIGECRQALREMPDGEGILYRTTMTVNNLGKIDVYQYIYFLCQHAKRHLAQMRGVEREFVEIYGNSRQIGTGFADT